MRKSREPRLLFVATVQMLLLAWSAVVVSVQVASQGIDINDKANLQYLFDRPLEPAAFPKGEKQVRFKIPGDDFTNRFSPPKLPEGAVAPLPEPAAGYAPQSGLSGPGSYGGAVSPVVGVPFTTLPNLSLALQLGKRDQFSLFVPFHREAAHELVDALVALPTFGDFFATSITLKDSLNPFLFAYATSVAALHRNDSRDAPLPLFAGRFPEKFFPGDALTLARREANVNEVPEHREPIEIVRDWTATDLEIEHRVAYFREDIGVNLAHWNWHLVYPNGGSDDIVKKDRRGELFYYFHQQLIARYNFERFSNRLGRVKRFLNWHDPIEEGYFPKLDSLLASRVWPSRPAGSRVSDVVRDDLRLIFDLQDLERWRDRIFDAIHSGQVLMENGTFKRLDEYSGIDILGNILEASPVLSINYNYYGNMHNLAHVAFGLCHDPDQRHLEGFGVIGDSSTAMRDPLFYRWHAFIDDMLQTHKETLQPYSDEKLSFDGITVQTADVVTEGLDRPNEFSTFWQQSDIDLSRGIDFTPRGAVLVRVTHLQHVPFSYHIEVHNSGKPRTGTVRIFMAPRFDERRRPLSFREQRQYFIEMDKFQHEFQPGSNTIIRQSTESSVTIPYERSFRDLSVIPQARDVNEQFNYCGCGWPEHMLVPKGSKDGFEAELFVMVSDYEDDKVDQPPENNACFQGHSLCGVFKQKYPDHRPMGFPFDRNIPNGRLPHFLKPNMAVTPVTITFREETKLRDEHPSLGAAVHSRNTL